MQIQSWFKVAPCYKVSHYKVAHYKAADYNAARVMRLSIATAQPSSIPVLPRAFLKPFSLMTAAAWLLTGCQQPPQYHYIEGETMGTSYHISYEQSDKVSAETIQQTIDQRLKQINDSMSTYQDDSIISTFNRLPANTPLKVDADFATVLTLSKQVYKQSQGAFDPTVMPLVKAWGFGGKMTVDHLQNPPSPEQIAAARALIDFDGVNLHGTPPSLTKDKDGVALDFSAIAKGYGVDAIAGVLSQNYHIKNYMVEIGGEVATSGVNEQHKPWQIAIDAPLTGSSVSDRKTISVIRQPMSDPTTGQMHIATSGNYRNSVVFNGVRYSHTIDPIKGSPVQGGAPSVTVAADSVALADAWATALTAMPYGQALKIATEQNLAAMFIVSASVPNTANQQPNNQQVNADANPDSMNQPNTDQEWQIIQTAAMEKFRGIPSP